MLDHISMSDSTFKYLDQSSTSNQESDAAQDFLDKKMSKNKFMAKDDPYAMGEGTVPTGAAYDDQRKVIKEASTTTGPMASGKMSAEQIRDQFGFTFNEEHANNSGGYSEHGGKDNGAIYNKTTGEYIGSIAGFKPHDGDNSAQGIGSFERIQDHELEHGFRTDKRSNWDSMNDVAGAVQNLIGNPEETKTEAVYADPEPIKHSPEIQQAKQRVKEYETDILSGKTSNEIYGKGEQQADDQYQLDLDGGAAGIGTNAASQSQEAAGTATASFLDKKVFDVKAKNQFQPTS